MGQRARSDAAARASTLRAQDDGTPWLVTGHRLSDELLERATEVLARRDALLGTRDERASIVDHQSATTALTRAWRELTDSITVEHAEPVRVMALIELLRDVKDTDDRIRDELLSRQTSATQVVREALASLRDVDSLDQLIERAPTVVAGIGFDRAVLSRIDESVWIPESAFVDGDPAWASEILDAGRQDLRTLDNKLLETQIVRRYRPLMVSDPVGRPDLHRALIDASMTRSYAAAPVVGWGRVIGFMHVDSYLQRRNLDAMDRDLLWMFCEGLGTLITRASALDTLNGMRAELSRLSSGVNASSGWSAASSPQRAQRTSPVCPPGWFADGAGDWLEPLSEVESVLTRREVDVLRLMSGGHTNAQIARRLVISEGTVKSHVKHILRKLDSANRAEAVSRWLRDEHARQGRGAEYARSRIAAR
ncbi:LuxR C-terminal-related transcriptional regulator [Pseudonocardia spinosispora]|uniref:LuxR C-terminal-related transcriptional regulator n=1 Tax=Pseudonocardia spinosispora TaxID=103441 RepID=UPI000419D2A2|nr:LuxR C-terminal-related transcriptional regulator [Pseudonocardia spinosispora]